MLVSPMFDTTTDTAETGFAATIVAIIALTGANETVLWAVSRPTRWDLGTEQGTDRETT